MDNSKGLSGKEGSDPDTEIISAKLKDVSLKKSRLMSENSHHYENYSLPASENVSANSSVSASPVQNNYGNSTQNEHGSFDWMKNPEHGNHNNNNNHGDHHHKYINHMNPFSHHHHHHHHSRSSGESNYSEKYSEKNLNDNNNNNNNNNQTILSNNSSDPNGHDNNNNTNKPNSNAVCSSENPKPNPVKGTSGYSSPLISVSKINVSNNNNKNAETKTLSGNSPITNIRHNEDIPRNTNNNINNIKNISPNQKLEKPNPRNYSSSPRDSSPSGSARSMVSPSSPSQKPQSHRSNIKSTIIHTTQNNQNNPSSNSGSSSPISVNFNQKNQKQSSSPHAGSQTHDGHSKKSKSSQSKSLANIAPKFVFSFRKHHHNNSSGSSSSNNTSSDANYAYSSSNNQNSSDNRTSPASTIVNRSEQTNNDHHTSFFGSHKLGLSSKDTNSSSFSLPHKPHSSMLELKRFFRPSKPKASSFLDRHSHSSPSNAASAAASAATQNHSSSKRSSSNLPSTPTDSSGSSIPFNASSASLNKFVPFGEDGPSLTKKYGKFGKILGSGAGGSVRVMKRASDGKTFAVKEFRPRQPYESEKEYAKKVTAEFCIGSTLHHPNIIETLDIVQEHGKFYEVMEYCPYDLFAIVMSGKMSKEEINCVFKQLLSGVAYLHDMGLAHRDLKLDNCVMSEDGIAKIIDFGSAAVFRYPFESEIVLAHGIVGSDPYLAPEVCTELKYDPQPADIWSLAIIYCCMSLRRFPWKAPRKSDNSFKLFCMMDDTSPDPLTGEVHSSHHHHHHHHQTQSANSGTPANKSSTSLNDNASETTCIETNNNNCKGNSNEDTISNKSKESLSSGSKSSKPNDINSTTTTSTPPTVNSPQSPNNPDPKIKQQQHHHHHHSDKPGHSSSSLKPSSSAVSTASAAPKPTNRGPWRLLRLLPPESRKIIYGMLSVDPTKRSLMKNVFEDNWIKETEMCTIKDGALVRSKNHHHTLVAPENAHLANYKKN